MRTEAALLHAVLRSGIQLIHAPSTSRYSASIQ